MVHPGNIKGRSLTELLQSYSLSRKSGSLRILTHDHTYQLYIFKGVLVAVSTSEPARKIGQYLISRGYLDEASLRDALEEQEVLGNRRLGEILATHGVLSPEQMERAVRERAEEIVADLFLLEEAVFHFDDRSVFPDELVNLDIDLDSLVLEGIRRKEEWARLQRVLGGESVRVRACPPAAPPPGSPTEFQSWLLKLVEADMSVGEVVIRSRRSAYEVYLALYRLLEEGRLEIVTGKAGRRSSPVVLDLKQLEEEVRTLARGRDYLQAWEHLRSLQSQLSDPPWLGELRSWLEKDEDLFLNQRYSEQSVPVLAVDMAQIRREELEPREGFLLSRLGEGMNLKTLCQVMPLAKVEILRLLHSLERRGIVRLVSGASPRRTC
jgi:hypothetical protein